ncbi:MAG: glycosyltransferase [Planctomycetota bacterium]|nr:glycosyltransferase [Planctomycetota bacterium]
MKVILTPVGSSGDVHPFLGLGMALRARGHEVAVLGNTHFAPLVQAAGLGQIELGTAEQYLAAIGNPDIWHPRRGFAAITGMTNQLIRPMYDALAELHEPGRTIVVSHSLGMGARVAQEKLGIPLVTMHLQPALFRSRTAPPRIADLLPGYSPLWFRRFVFWVGDRAFVDPIIGQPLNAFRAELGFAPVKGIFRDWWNSPQRVLAMFPEWFAPQQPDWPPQTRLVGFPLYDERGLTAPPPELEAFLNAGDKPIVFTPGSAMRFGQAFFQAAAEACKILGRRGILLTRFPEQIPRDLPPDVRHFDFVPLSKLLPRAAAMVHHGGIGTLSQTLAAGIPHLIMPMAHDQPDNAERVRRLGVGASLSRSHFKGPAVARELASLLGSPHVAVACREVASRFQGVDALTRACEEIEAVGPATFAGSK